MRLETTGEEELETSQRDNRLQMRRGARKWAVPGGERGVKLSFVCVCFGVRSKSVSVC